MTKTPKKKKSDIKLQLDIAQSNYQSWIYTNNETRRNLSNHTSFVHYTRRSLKNEK